MLADLFTVEVNRRFIVPMEIIASTAPFIAAVIARRSLLREPAGLIALGWGLSTAGSIYKTAMNRSLVPPTLVVHRLELLLVTACLLYGAMQWIDGVARRTRWLVVAGWCVAWAFTLLISERREFSLLTQPLQSTILLAVSGAAVASRVRRADAELTGADWFWILTGHITYFAATLIRQPIQESLVRYHLNWGLPLQFAIMLVYAASYLIVARGMLLTGPERRSTPDGFPLTRPA